MQDEGGDYDDDDGVGLPDQKTTDGPGAAECRSAPTHEPTTPTSSHLPPLRPASFARLHGGRCCVEAAKPDFERSRYRCG